MRVRGFCCGWIEMDLGGLLDGGRGPARFPVAHLMFGHEPEQWPTSLEDDRVMELSGGGSTVRR